MQPRLGTFVFDTLFENITDDLVRAARDSIEDSFKYWLPYVELNNLLIRADRQRGYLHYSFDVSITTLGANVVINMLLDEGTVLDIQVVTEADNEVNSGFALVPISSAPVTSPGSY